MVINDLDRLDLVFMARGGLSSLSGRPSLAGSLTLWLGAGKDECLRQSKQATGAVFLGLDQRGHSNCVSEQQNFSHAERVCREDIQF